LGVGDPVVEDFWAGVGVGVGFEGFALGEGIGVGSGVATGFVLELAARVEPGPVLLAKFELPPLRAELELPPTRVDGEVDRTAAFLFAGEGETPRWLGFEFLFDPVLLFGPVLVFEPVFEAERNGWRPAFEAIAAFPPATVNTTSRRLPRCSTRADAPGGRRKEIRVLSPTRCTRTSAKPRPRNASARGTSAPGIFM
jgi:hypothetical protein